MKKRKQFVLLLCAVLLLLCFRAAGVAEQELPGGTEPSQPLPTVTEPPTTAPAETAAAALPPIVIALT